MIHAAIRAATIEEARRLLDQRPIYLDTETTGLSKWSEIVEIALVDHDGRVLLETLVQPRKPIPANVIRIHGITNQHVRHAPPWTEVWPQVQSILAGRPTVIYNAAFDLRMMEQSHRLARLPWRGDDLRPVCLMRLYARFYGERRRGSFKWQSLANAARQCRIDLPNSHRAADDARLARAVLLHVAGR